MRNSFMNDLWFGECSSVVQDLQSILSHVLNDADQKIKDSYADTLACDRSPNEEDETLPSEEEMS